VPWEILQLNMILATISLVVMFFKHFSKLTSRALEARVKWRNSSLRDSCSKLMWINNPRVTRVS